MSETTLLDVLLHDIGEGLADATVVEWLVTPGQPVKEDQPIVLISTDKATVELPAPASGVMREHAVPVGGMVSVGSLLARIEVTAKNASRAGVPSGASADKSASAGPTASSAAQTSAPASTANNNVVAAPSTRKLAQELKVDLTQIIGSGPNGRIVEDDVRRAAAGTSTPASTAASTASSTAASASATSHDDETRTPLNRTRLATARAMTAAWRDVPHIVEFREIDATTLQRAREQHRAAAEREGMRLTFLPFFIKAVSVALTRHPNFNARLDMDRQEIITRRHCNIGIATASDAGLIVPVLHSVEAMSLLDIARAIDPLTDRAKRQVLSQNEMTGGTFTVTNFGSYGTRHGIPIVRAPEVGIAGFGRIYEGVVAVDGTPAVRPILPFTVSADHRANDGVHLAQFLDTLSEVLTNPTLLDLNADVTHG